MKEIKLFFDFEFTSLSPDAQPISLGIVSEEITRSVRLIPDDRRKEGETTPEFLKRANEENIGDVVSKSGDAVFYAEFSDFDLNRCDDWVKENVVGKLHLRNKPEKCHMYVDQDNCQMIDNSGSISNRLLKWLSQFSDCNIQFVCDCGTFDWYWMLQLLAKWEGKYTDQEEDGYFEKVSTGLPKLPDNISPVPEDLNDLIAHKKGISVREAFELNREELVFAGLNFRYELIGTCARLNTSNPTHHALWDAKVIKEVYGKLALNENVYDTKTIDLRWINEMEDYEFAKFIDYMKELGLVVDNSKLEFSFVPKLKE